MPGVRAVLVALFCSATVPICWSAGLSVFAEATADRRSPGGGWSAGRTGSPERLALQTFRVRLDTSKGPIVIEVHHEWAPHGASRFHELVTSRYFDDSRFFRVVKGQWAQFGINADPVVASRWRMRTIPDDPRAQSNTRGRVAFAFAVPNGRTTQVYIVRQAMPSRSAKGFFPLAEF